MKFNNSSRRLVASLLVVAPLVFSVTVARASIFDTHSSGAAAKVISKTKPHFAHNFAHSGAKHAKTKHNAKNLHAATVHIATANAKQLMTLKGVGNKRAQEIIAYRKQQKLTSLDQLKNVKGVGARGLKRMQNLNAKNLQI